MSKKNKKVWGVRFLFFLVPYAFFEKEKVLVSRTTLSLPISIKICRKQKKPTFAWVAWYDGLSAVAVCCSCRGSSGWRGAIQRQHTSAYVSIRQHTSAYLAVVDGDLLKSNLLPPYFSYKPFHFTSAYLAVAGGELLKSSLLPPYFSYRPFHFLTRKVSADVCVHAFS
jgi:hypothetical protein